ncbi:hypothetical protein PFISCL1PPCAC_26930, partial [Pristionchus fissidentatus]
NIKNGRTSIVFLQLYVFVLPMIAIVTLITNLLVIGVLSKKNLRTPTNYILLTMALCELLTGLSSAPWSVYYLVIYDITPDLEMSDWWCRYHQFFALHMPALFHTAAIWLTCYLAIQRYFYISMPSLMASSYTEE